jgi:hypothetical protein
MTIDRKKPRAGGEIDAYCTKCRMDLNHRIIAVVEDDAKGTDVKRVMCLTCNGEHNYRRPLAEREREKEKKAERKAIHAGTTGSKRETTPKTERSARASWEKAIAGQPPTAFKTYTIRNGFEVGDLVKHTRFGDGVVARVVDPQKVEIIFEDGPRTMAQNVP